ncbi:hypothetical protein ACD661_03855 [Legionella lytica]|uniref:Uncharacterized protein n=1 Tax=Legionella lytica TaxID=96232 RepID=A0ABW8D658_9GAMM
MPSFSIDLQKIANNDPSFKNLEPDWTITDDRVLSLAAALVNNSSLLSIDLWGTQFSDEHLNELTKALETHKKLSSLNLGKNQITELGASYIGELIEKNNVLIALILTRNALGGEGAKAIAQGLRANYGLSSLKLDHTAIDDHGAQALFTVLTVNTSLNFLDLSNNEITDLSVPYIIRMFGQNSTLSSLNLKQNSISHENLKEIDTLLGRNEQIYNIAQTAIDAIRKLPSEMPNWEQKGAFDNFNAVLKLKEQAQLEIETLFPGSRLVARIEEVWAGKQITILLTNPQITPESGAIELFDSLNSQQKQYPQYQQWLESMIFHYFSSIQPNSEYTYKKLLSYILQIPMSTDIQRLMDLCVFHQFNPEVILKPEPIQLVRSLIDNREALKTLQKEIPAIDKLVLNIITRFYAEEQSSKEIEINTQIIGVLLELPQNVATNLELNAALLRSLNLFFCATPNKAASFYKLWNHLSAGNELSPENLATEEVAKKSLIKKYYGIVLQISPNHYQNRFFIQQNVRPKKQDTGPVQEYVEQIPPQNAEPVQEQRIEPVQEQHAEPVEEQNPELVQEPLIEQAPEQNAELVPEQHLEQVPELNTDLIQEQQIDLIQEQNTALVEEQNAGLELEEEDGHVVLMRP